MLEQTADGQPILVTLLILMCGSCKSGQTTTILDLSERLKSEVVPRTHDDSGITFESMKHTGGRHDGQPIQTQLVTQPQATSTEIRRRLAEGAHAVLFVADTTRTGIEASTEEFRIIEQVVARSPEPQPVIIIQANKRDAHDAVSIDEVKSLFGADGDRIVVETIATRGDGVRQAFVYAVRKGLENLTAARKIDSECLEETTVVESKEPKVNTDIVKGSEPTFNSETDDLSTDKLSYGFVVKPTDSSSRINDETSIDNQGPSIARPEEPLPELSQEPEHLLIASQGAAPPTAEGNVLTRLFRFLDGG